MVKLRLSKKVLFLIGGLIFIGIVVALTIAMTTKDRSLESPDKTTETSAKSKSLDQTNVVAAPEAPTPPDQTKPEACKKISETTVAQTMGVASVKSTGTQNKTQQGAELAQCTYIKDEKMATIRIYEYKDESTANSDLAKVKMQASASANKSKYNVVITVSTTVGADMTAANKLLPIVLEKL